MHSSAWHLIEGKNWDGNNFEVFCTCGFLSDGNFKKIHMHIKFKICLVFSLCYNLSLSSNSLGSKRSTWLSQRSWMLGHGMDLSLSEGVRPSFPPCRGKPSSFSWLNNDHCKLHEEAETKMWRTLAGTPGQPSESSHYCWKLVSLISVTLPGSICRIIS